ncbi:cytochrome b5 reductase 4 [Lepeophtheirus salmonis]|uniref:cytochrome b5 reductase 4 n=1 Tax=Lepeophtheirus salmonis TaxID=72036 RepID=UPI001AE79280|nr:cytochrome b5 reductase 4-like [Lepeophtheirus salmonis]
MAGSSSNSKTTLSLPTKITSTGSATGNPRNKTALQPGCSLMDWVALMNSGKDLTGTGGRMIKVTKEELKKHGPEDKEPWIALQGLVYNISHYKRFHPGGVDELLRGAGKDATKLFNEVHPWVSFQSMLSKCLVGKLVEKILPPIIPPKKPVHTLLPPPVPPIPTLKSDFYQTDNHIVINIYVKRQHLSEDHVVIEKIKDSSLNEIRILVLNYEDDFIESIYSFGDFKVQNKDLKVKISPQGKIEISFLKYKCERAPSIKMISLERKLRFEDSLLRSWTLLSKEIVTHDVFEFKFKKPSHLLHFQVSLGHHVPLSLNSIEKMYTPISGGHDNDSLRFLIKIYEDGALTPLLHSLNLGDEIQIGNPRGSLRTPNVEKRIRLFAGGTGFTPMTRLIEHYLNLNQDVHLYFFNKTRKDIIYRQKIEEWMKGNLSVIHILSKDSDAEPPFLHGRISKNLLGNLLDEEDMDRTSEQIFICGPSSFTQETFRLLTEHFVYSSRNVFKFGS